MSAERIRDRSVVGVLSVAVLVLALFASSVSGDTTAPLYAKMKQRFTTAKPGAWTGWSFDGALKPLPAGQQVPPQRGATFVFPRGTRFDLNRVGACPATDAQLMSEGLGACPPRSRVGSGSSTLFLGLAGELSVKVAFFVTQPGAAVALVLATDSGAVLRVLRGTIKANRIFATIAPAPLPGGFEASVTQLALDVGRAGTRKHSFIRTPESCPRSGHWTFVYLPRYDPPYGVQRSTSSVRCLRG